MTPLETCGRPHPQPGCICVACSTARSRAASALGRAGTGEAKVRGDAEHYRSIRSRRRPLPYVAGTCEGDYRLMRWDAAASCYRDGPTYRTLALARAALREERARLRLERR